MDLSQEIKFNSVPLIDELQIYTDGASRDNPGKSAIAFRILDRSGKLIIEHKEYIGIATNNEAEYKAMIKALETAKKYSNGKVRVYSDSQLVVNQMNGDWRIKDKELKKLSQILKNKENAFKSVTYNNVNREHKNLKIVDALANEALDGS
jgi:ribonuclease HI